MSTEENRMTQTLEPHKIGEALAKVFLEWYYFQVEVEPGSTIYAGLSLLSSTVDWKDGTVHLQTRSEFNGVETLHTFEFTPTSMYESEEGYVIFVTKDNGLYAIVGIGHR